MEQNNQEKKTTMVRTDVHTTVLLRLPEETPAKAALREARKYAPKPRGGQKITWLKLVDKDFENVSIKVMVKNGGGIYSVSIRNCSHEMLANNRHIWQVVVDRAVSSS